jgi:acetyl esterase
VGLDPAVREFLDTKPDSGDPDDSVAVRRAAIRKGSDALFAAFGAPVDAVSVEQDILLPRPGGDLRVRVYRPGPAPGLPIHVFVHGGGFWLGSIDERVNEAMCRDRCRRAECVVVAIEYRLAPEHRFPAPVEDCYAGLLARDRGGPRLRLQLLEVPALDLTLEQMRSSGVGNDYGVTVAEMELCRDLYLPSAEQGRDPLASPLHAHDLGGLPDAHIMTAEFDPLRNDGERFAARLDEAGVAVSHHRYPGAVHGSLALTDSWPPAQLWHDDVVRALRETHAR